MGKFVSVKNDGRLPGTWNLFQTWLALEASAAKQFKSPNDFEKCIGQFHANYWIVEPLDLNDILYAVQIAFDRASTHPYDFCFCFDYHDGYVLFFATGEAELDTIIKNKMREMFAIFGEEYLKEHRPDLIALRQDALNNAG